MQSSMAERTIAFLAQDRDLTGGTRSLPLSIICAQIMTLKRIGASDWWTSQIFHIHHSLAYVFPACRTTFSDSFTYIQANYDIKTNWCERLVDLADFPYSPCLYLCISCVPSNVLGFFHLYTSKL